jgi:hypothetical protein
MTLRKILRFSVGPIPHFHLLVPGAQDVHELNQFGLCAPQFHLGEATARATLKCRPRCGLQAIWARLGGTKCNWRGHQSCGNIRLPALPIYDGQAVCDHLQPSKRLQNTV